MSRPKKAERGPVTRGRPATTLEARENQLIALAYDLAERQFRDGTASSQVTTEFLKRGSTRARLEKEMMEEQKKLLKAKTEALEAEARVEEIYQKALDAMRVYSGHPEDQEYDD